MDQKDYQRRRLVEWLVAEITRTTGRCYGIKLEALDDESLRALQRLLRDLDHEKQMACSRLGSSPGGGEYPATPALQQQRDDDAR